MNYIVVDFEFNQFFPFKKNAGSSGSNPLCPFEIIQIGAVKLDSEFNQTGSFDVYIKPEIYKRIHPFVEKITGITAKTLENGTNFKSAYRDFLEFAGQEPSVLCTWGIDDIKSLYKNIIFHKEDMQLITDKYINVQKYASQFLKTENGSTIGLKNAADLLDIHLEDTFHNALTDAKYTAEVFKAVMPEDFTPNTFDPMSIVKIQKRSRTMSVPSLISHGEKLIGRPLTEDEITLVKDAYALGQLHSFDTPASGKNSGPDKHKK